MYYFLPSKSFWQLHAHQSSNLLNSFTLNLHSTCLPSNLAWAWLMVPRQEVELLQECEAISPSLLCHFFLFCFVAAFAKSAGDQFARGPDSEKLLQHTWAWEVSLALMRKNGKKQTLNTNLHLSMFFWLSCKAAPTWICLCRASAGN